MNSTNVRNHIAFLQARLQVSLASAFAPGTAVDKAQRLFLTPPRIPHTQRERALLATGRGFTVDAPVARLSAWRFGEAGRPLVLLSHGWGGRGAQFREFIPALVAAGYQAVTFDHAGHGHSKGSESSLVHFSQGVEAMARHLEAQGETISGAIGHSLGSPAIAAWLKRSGRSPRVVLVAPPHSIGSYAGRFARALGLPDRLRREMQSGIERRFGVPWTEFELPHAVADIAAPALVIHDAGDREVPMASGLAVARAWQDARFVETQGLGHRAILRDPGVVRDAIDFLSGSVSFPLAPARGEARAFATPAPLY